MNKEKWKRSRRTGWINRSFCFLGLHDWDIYQHNVRTDEDTSKVFVIAWKQCIRCASSKLIHILE